MRPSSHRTQTQICTQILWCCWQCSLNTPTAVCNIFCVPLHPVWTGPADLFTPRRRPTQKRQPGGVGRRDCLHKRRMESRLLVWKSFSPSSHRTQSTSQHMHANYGTHCGQWECSHSLQATSKGLHANVLTRPVWTGPLDPRGWQLNLAQSEAAFLLHLTDPISAFYLSNITGSISWLSKYWPLTQ